MLLTMIQQDKVNNFSKPYSEETAKVIDMKFQLNQAIKEQFKEENKIQIKSTC
jgi:hypothetical protein